MANQPSEKQAFIEEYRNNRQRLRQQLQPSKMLPLLQKSIRKLELKNLEKWVDKLDFDLEIEESSIFKSIQLIRGNIQQLRQSYSLQNMAIVKEGIDQFREENMTRFDQFGKREDQLDSEIEMLTKFLPDMGDYDQMIEQEDFESFSNESYEEGPSTKGATAFLHKDPIERVQEIDKQLKLIGGAKGKWLESDHSDFMKIFTKNKGNQQKIVKECMQMLGLNNMTVLQHLQHYEKYLELNEEKKVLTAEYKRNKNLKEQQEKVEREEREKKKKDEELRKRQEAQAEQERKKQLVKEYKERKMSEERKMEKVESRKEVQSRDKNKAEVSDKKMKVEQMRMFKFEEDKKIKELEAKLKQMMKLPPKPKK